MKPVIFVLGVSALPLARTLKSDLDGEIHAPNCVGGGDVTYAKATSHLTDLFKAGRDIVGICASGILIRALAPHLGDKHAEPAVVAVAEDGSSTVPLLGGHHGANQLARRIAAITKGHAAITTASDVRFGHAFDEERDGYTLGNPQDVKQATSWKLSGGDVEVETTDHIAEGGPHHILYHPHTLAIGVGCERGTSPQEVIDLIERTLRQNNLSIKAVAGFASIDLKEDEPAINELCNVRFFSAAELNELAPRLKTPSDYVLAEVGTPGVAEAAALAAAGPGAELVVAKTKSQRATCAVARSPTPITKLRGKSRGILSVVGIGPGSAATRSPAAHHALQAATDWVGYDLYLDLAADARHQQIEHRFPLGGEEARCRHAIELAKDGKNVALVCSGDAGIYAMAALVYELTDLEPTRIRIDVHPGISAFQAAAAKAGAMIGHDFCCISLSDLLTPWEVIERRVTAAAQGDFVISFYNPRSLKRRDQLERAFDILKEHRPNSTPVIIASNLGRPTETVKIVSLGKFDAIDVDMLTLVMVGSSQSTTFQRGDGQTYAYTPRGYAKKRVKQ